MLRHTSGALRQCCYWLVALRSGTAQRAGILGHVSGGTFDVQIAHCTLVHWAGALLGLRYGTSEVSVVVEAHGHNLHHRFAAEEGALLVVLRSPSPTSAHLGDYDWQFLEVGVQALPLKVLCISVEKGAY